MLTGRDRLERVMAALRETGLDGLVCTLPSNVLLLSGYWPVVGTAVAVASRDGRVVVLAPTDEQDLATQSWAEVRTYSPGRRPPPLSRRARRSRPCCGIWAWRGRVLVMMAAIPTSRLRTQRCICLGPRRRR